jgi:D-glycero-D-manno-heptose 1,7-bisphosphate phosphatase
MNKALFLDRDGVLNRELGHYVTSLDQFEVLPTVPSALQLAAQSGFLLIIISNQGGVAKGLYTMQDVLDMQDKLQDALRPFGVKITEGYYCPHHPDFEKCECRKPQSQMKAIARFDIDATQSVMIGDKERDIIAANGAGVRGILIESNADLLAVVKGLV